MTYTVPLEISVLFFISRTSKAAAPLDQNELSEVIHASNKDYSKKIPFGGETLWRTLNSLFNHGTQGGDTLGSIGGLKSVTRQRDAWVLPLNLLL